MSKTIAIAAICMLIIVPASAQNISYVLSSVSEPVKKNAQTVTRFENTVFEVADINRATLSAHKVVTVIGQQGKRRAEFRSVYRQVDDAGRRGNKGLQFLRKTGQQVPKKRYTDDRIW
jgi:hypothetical protein